MLRRSRCLTSKSSVSKGAIRGPLLTSWTLSVLLRESLPELIPIVVSTHPRRCIASGGESELSLLTDCEYWNDLQSLRLSY